MESLMLRSFAKPLKIAIQYNGICSPIALGRLYCKGRYVQMGYCGERKKILEIEGQGEFPGDIFEGTK